MDKMNAEFENFLSSLEFCHITKKNQVQFNPAKQQNVEETKKFPYCTPPNTSKKYSHT